VQVGECIGCRLDPAARDPQGMMRQPRSRTCAEEARPARSRCDSCTPAEPANAPARPHCSLFRAQPLLLRHRLAADAGGDRLAGLRADGLGAQYWSDRLLMRFLLALALSLIAGAVAHTYDYRWILLSSQVAPLLCSGSLLITTLAGAVQIWLVVLAVLLAVARAFENPARQSLLSVLVLPERFGGAVPVPIPGPLFAVPCLRKRRARWTFS